MAVLLQFPELRPHFLKAWLLSPLIMCPGGMSAQTQPVLAGQTYTYTLPADSYQFSYQAFISGQCFSPTSPTATLCQPTVTNIPGTNSYVTQPLTFGEYTFVEETLEYGSPYFYNVTSFPVFQADGNSPRSLIGQYAFQLTGRAATGAQAGASFVAAAGSFTADGKGNITAGVLDINSPIGIAAGESITGTYRINASGIGTLNLKTLQGTLQLSLASVPLTTSSNGQYTAYGYNQSAAQANVSFPIAAGGTVETTAGGLVSASGTFAQLGIPSITSASDPSAQQYPAAQPAPAATLNGSFFASLSGQHSSGAARLQFTAAGTVTADVTLASNGTLADLPGWTGTYTPFNTTTGRSVLTLTSPAQLGAPAQVFSMYETNQGGTLYLVSTAPGQAAGLLTGRADQQ